MQQRTFGNLIAKMPFKARAPFEHFLRRLWDDDRLSPKDIREKPLPMGNLFEGSADDALERVHNAGKMLMRACGEKWPERLLNVK